MRFETEQEDNNLNKLKINLTKITKIVKTIKKVIHRDVMIN